jgi:hypothetical protein
MNGRPVLPAQRRSACDSVLAPPPGTVPVVAGREVHPPAVSHACLESRTLP